MSVHNPSSLKRGNSEKKKKLTAKSREVIELEAILADLQDSPLKLGSPVKYSPSHVRCSPRKNSAQKMSSPVGFKCNLEKDYSLPGKVVKKIDFKSPSKRVPSSSSGSSNGNNVVSPRKISKAIGVPSHLFNDKRTNCVELDASNIAKVLEDSDSESVAPTEPNTPSNVKHVNGVHTVSSHKLSVTKRNSNLGNKSLTSKKSENLDSSDCDAILKNGIIKMPTSLKELNLSKLDSIASLNIYVNSSAEHFTFETQKMKTTCNEKLDTNDIAAMLENSDDDDDDDVFTLHFNVNGARNNCDSEIVSETVPSSTSDIQRVMGSSRRKSNLKLEEYRMGYDDEDIIIIKDYVSTPETSSKSLSKKIRSGYGSPKPASSSKQHKGTVDRSESKPKKNKEFDDDLMIEEKPKSNHKNNPPSKKKGISTSRKDSQAKKKEASDSTDSSRKSKARRSLLQEATYSIEDCSQSPLRLKLKRNASTVVSSNCNDPKDDSDEEPVMKLRKTEASTTETKYRTAAKTSDTKNDKIDCTPAIKDGKTQSLKRKSIRSTVTVEDEEGESSEDEPLIKLRRTETDLDSETKPKEKSLRSRESIKLPKWRLMNETNGIASLKSPTKSPKSPNYNLNFNTPKKRTTPNKQCDSPKFDQLVAAVQNKFGKGKGFPVTRVEEIEKEQETMQKTPNKNGLSKSVLSPSKKASAIDRVPLELNECNSRPSRSKAKAVESVKIENDSPNNLIKKLSNKENLLRSSSEQSFTNDFTRSSSKKGLQHNLNSPLKVNSVARDEIPPDGIKKSKDITIVIESSLDKARIQLMVSAVPKSLPCRDKEFNNIYSFLGRKIEDFAGGCMYISGVPGTGKTATVHAVIRKLQEDVEKGDLSPFDFVEINSLRLTEPRQAYTRILQSLTGNKLPSEQALRMLDNKFSGRGRKSTVLLVDELDYLCNRKQDVIYSILEWPMRQGSGVVVLTIANTMDLPERTLKGKVTSRMGLTRLTFQPYTHHQLQEIVMNRLIGNDSFHPDAVQLVARKVAAVSGDARRALDICRRATELVSPTKGESSKTVTIEHVEKAVSQISSGRSILAIKACSTMAQLALRALRDETLRTGIDESNVSHMHKHLLNICALEGVEKPTFGEIQRICTNLESLGLIIAEKGRPDLMRKLSLNVSSDDIHYALNC